MNSKTGNAVATIESSKSLVTRLAQKYGVEPEKFLGTLKATAFRGDGRSEISNEQMMALLLVAEAHNLNPWLKEIYAFPDKNNGIVPIIGIDGFIKIANEHSAFAGMDFEYADDGSWVECMIRRKDRDLATKIREYREECYRDTPAWNKWPRRMLRHRAIAQAVRVAFGFSGVMEQDEAEAYIEGSVTETRAPAGKPRTAPPKAIAAPTVEAQPTEVDFLRALDKSGVPFNAVAEHFELVECVEPRDFPAEKIPEALAWIKEVAGA